MRPAILALTTCLLATALVGCLTPLEPTSAGAPVVVDGGPGPVVEGAPGGFSDTHVFPGNYSAAAGWSRVLAPGAHAVLDPEIVALESDLDGANLEIGLFLPFNTREGARVPVIVHASPYIYGGMSPEGLKSDFIHPFLVENFVPHGYAVAFVPVRGTANQGGCSDLLGPREQADLDQAVTWLGTREWSNGNVAMVGASYDGATAWEVAATGNPHLKTIVPISGISDLFHLQHRNGTREQEGVLLANALYYTSGFRNYGPDNGRSLEHVVRSVVCPEAWEGLAASGYASAAGVRDPTGFWAERNHRPGVEANYNGSVLLVHGLRDIDVDPSHAYPWVNTLEARGVVVKHLLGQWAHAYPDHTLRAGEPLKHPRLDWAEILLHWLDYWLQGDTSRDLGPRVQVQDSSGQWRSADAWPPADAAEARFYLAPGGALSREPADSGDALLLGPGSHPVTWQGEPVCTACAAFATEVFDEAFRFAGVPQVHVTVTPTGPGGHVAAHLYVVNDTARQKVGKGQMDLRFAGGGEEMHPVIPGEPLVARMVLEPLDVVVPAGAHLELEFHQGTTVGRLPSTPTYPVLLHAGGDASTFAVRTFHVAPGAFFTPPAS